MLTRALAISLRTVLTFAVLFTLSASLYAAQKNKTDSHRLPVNPADAPPAPGLSPGLVLMGGGTEGPLISRPGPAPGELPTR